jgi:hypothetical protein
MTIAELIAQLQQFDSAARVEFFSHSTNSLLELYVVELDEDTDNTVTIHFDVE